MRIATFNAASVRARLPLLVEWLAENEPDVLAIQETKVEDDKFPASEFEDLGYQLALYGQKSWNGVATLARSTPTNIRRGFMDELFPNDARLLTCDVDGVTIINSYVPNGSTVGSDKFAYKLKWLERFRVYLDQHFTPNDQLIWLGDINIAPEPIDVYDSAKLLGGVGHNPEEFRRLKTIVEFGLVDVFRQHHSGPGDFTYWDFTIPNSLKRNLGWRIDHIYATQSVAQTCTNCLIDREARAMERPSDHTFVVADFNL